MDAFLYDEWRQALWLSSGSEGKRPIGCYSQIGIDPGGKNEPMKLSVVIGPDAWLPNGVQLIRTDKAVPITALFKWCASTRCIADNDLSDASVQVLRTQHDSGKIVYKDATQVDVSIPVSFNGFGDALDALQKQ